jgi:hypothetical protein
MATDASCAVRASNTPVTLEVGHGARVGHLDRQLGGGVADALGAHDLRPDRDGADPVLPLRVRQGAAGAPGDHDLDADKGLAALVGDRPADGAGPDRLRPGRGGNGAGREQWFHRREPVEGWLRLGRGRADAWDRRRLGGLCCTNVQ